MSKDDSTRGDESSRTEAASVNLQSVSRVIPEEIQSLLGKRPIVTGEEPESYDDLLARIGNTIRPKDAIEWLWAKDIVDFAWEIQRYRRLKAAHLEAAREDALASILTPLCKDIAPEDWYPHDYARELAKAWVRGDASARETVDTLFSENAFDLDTVMARALFQRIDSYERIDRLIAAAEARRDRLLREIDIRRANHARQRQLPPLQAHHEGMPIPDE